MNKRLIILADDKPGETINWALIDSVTRQILETGSSLINDLSNLGNINGSDTGLDVYLVFNGFHVNYQHADIPAKTEAQARAAVPYILEDNLSSAPENLHFALGPQLDDTLRPVAVIARDLLDAWLNTLKDNHIRPIGAYADFNCLSVQDIGDATRVYQTPENDYIIISSNGAANRIDSDLAELVAPSLFDSNAGEFILYADTHPSWFTAQVTHRQSLTVEGFYLAYSDSISNENAINILQGEYANRASFKDLWMVWKRPMIMAGMLAFIFAGYFLVETWQLSRSIDRLDRETQTAMQEAFPGVRSINQVRSRLRASQSNATDRFLLLSEVLFDSVQENENVSVISTRYDENRGELSVSLNTGSFNDVELVKNAVARRGASLNEGASRQIDSRVVADVIIRENAS